VWGWVVCGDGWCVGGWVVCVGVGGEGVHLKCTCVEGVRAGR